MSMPTLEDLWQEYRRTLNYVFLFTAFINLLMLAPIFYMMQVYDRVLNSQSIPTLVLLTLIVAVMYITRGFLEFARARILIRASLRLDSRFTRQVYDAMFRAMLRDHSQESAQALEDVVKVRQFLTGSALLALLDLPWGFLFLAVLFLFHAWVGWFAVAIVLMELALMLAHERLTRQRLKDATGFHIDARAEAIANLRNAEITEALGMAEGLRGRWLSNHLSALRKQKLASDVASTFSALSSTLRSLAQSLVIGLVAYLVIQGDMTGGMIMAANVLLGRATSPLNRLIGSWKQLTEARGAYDRLKGLLEKYLNPPPQVQLPPPTGRLLVENLFITPPGRYAPVLRGIAFALEPGQLLAVVGKSGSGKSSLARALLGIWSPMSGRVRLDGADIASWTRQSLGPHVGYLPQEVELFDGTVAENIARFGVIDSEQVLAAARLAHIHDLILQLPRGYDTRLGAGGQALSGGQRQRLGLARALYRQPRLVVLDEPYSNLDSEGEEALFSALGLLRATGCTVILITHRMSFAHEADRVLVLRDGTTYLFGAREEVIAHLAAPRGGERPQVRPLRSATEPALPHNPRVSALWPA